MDEYEVKDGKKDGLYIRWRCTGELHCKIHYSDGYRHGKYEAYHRNCKLQRQRNYVHNWWDNGSYLDGLCTQWYKNGQIKEEYKYRNNGDRFYRTDLFIDGKKVKDNEEREIVLSYHK